ncbi:MAG: short-chain dehydrogenase [Candidatus Cloacimonadota bacterium]|nr:MAG: short-chain dehydrogenase [Candidatus Cloacimonadota bacterium]
MNEVALITGASSGIGYNIAIELAKRSWDLVVIARRESKLLDLKKEIEKKYKVKVYVYAMDITVNDKLLMLQNKIIKENLFVSLLINNAGFGSSGYFHKLNLDKELNMIDLNIKALMKMCHIFSQEMVKKSKGHIINVASVAAFQPGPGMNTYFASKAFVLHFSEGLNEELSSFGVKCSALCPGTTKTEFFDIAEAMDLEASPLPSMSASSVAKITLDGVDSSSVIIVPGLFNKLMCLSVRFVPRIIIRKFLKFLLLRRSKVD